MATLLRRGIILHHPCVFKCNQLGVFIPSTIQRPSLVLYRLREIFHGNFLHCQHLRVNDRCFSTSTQPERLCWEGSSHDALLRKLDIALKDHRVDDAWVTFNDFKKLYGFPTGSMVSKLITELSYSSDPSCLQKACDLIFILLKEKSAFLHHEILAKLSLCLARAQRPVPTSNILRVMLDRGSIPPVDVLGLTISHMVQTEIGASLASNFLVQLCGYFLHLHEKRNGHAKLLKPDTMIFNLVLGACVRFEASLKGQQLIELMSRVGIIADAHSIILINQIHEMNGQRDEIKRFKDHIDRVSAPFVCHYRQFYDCLLNLHFKFDDIDAAAELILDIHKSSLSMQRLGKDTENSFLVPIGSHNLRSGMTIQITPELLQKDSIIIGEHKPELVIFSSGKLLLSNRAFAKLIIGWKRHGRISDLSMLLLRIQKDYDAIEGSGLCSKVIDACIRMGWLEMAHDILDDMNAAGATMNSVTYMALLTAYYNREMFKEATALLRQMRKAGLVQNLSDEVVASKCLSEAAYNLPPSTSGFDLTDFLIQDVREEGKGIPPLVLEFNSSIYFFCKAKMMEDALKTYRRMQVMKMRPTPQTYAYLINGYLSMEMFGDITILWGDIKRMEYSGFTVSRDLYELLLLIFLQGGYFERAMEVIGYMEGHNMYTDKLMYKSEFLKLHKNLYRGLKASEARTEGQSKRLEFVRRFRKWVGIA